MSTKQNLKKKTLDKAALGRKYYDVLDIYTSNILTSIAESSGEFAISKDSLKKIEDICLEQKLKARDWGFTQIVKLLQE